MDLLVLQFNLESVHACVLIKAGKRRWSRGARTSSFLRHLDRLWRLGVSRCVSMGVSTLVFPAGVPAAVQRAAPPARRSYSGHCLVQTGRALPAAPMMVMFWPMSLGDAIQWADLGDIIP